MIYIILRTTYTKIPPKVVRYRNYKNVSEQEFRGDVTTGLTAINPETHDEFENFIKQALDKHAPIKTAIHRGNNKPHVHKEMRKAMMKRMRLKNIANKSKSHNDFQRYKKQRNLVVKINRMAKRQFYANLDPMVVGKDKVFWKTFKPIFSKQSNTNERIVLLEDNTIISADKEISNCFNSYFVNITDTLCLNEPGSIDGLIPFNDPVLNAVRKYENHPSIARIKINIRTEEIFEFQPVSSLDVWKSGTIIDFIGKSSQVKVQPNLGSLGSQQRSLENSQETCTLSPQEDSTETCSHQPAPEPPETQETQTTRSFESQLQAYVKAKREKYEEHLVKSKAEAMHSLKKPQEKEQGKNQNRKKGSKQNKGNLGKANSQSVNQSVHLDDKQPYSERVQPQQQQNQQQQQQQVQNSQSTSDKSQQPQQKDKLPPSQKGQSQQQGLWRPGTILIVGDSMLNGVEERKMPSNVKVRNFPGSTVKDMHDYVKPLLRKKPSHVILHVGTNDAVNSDSNAIVNQLINLKEYIENELPNSTVTLSLPMMRADDANK